MTCKKYMQHLVALVAATALPTVAFGQAGRQLSWQQDISYLQALAPSEAAAQSAPIEKIRTDIELWAKVHPEAKLTLAAAPPQPMNAASAAAEIKELNRAISGIVANDPNHPFHLGVATVNVSANNGIVSELSPLADTISQKEMQTYNLTNAAQALNMLPGVSLIHSYGGRNQVMVSIHGFSSYQVPLYVDGILMNDPYDGTLDFRQIPTLNIAEIQVAKGFSSPALGPNAVGGAINIVTKQPQKLFEGDMQMGAFSGDGMLASAVVGSRLGHFMVQGSIDWLQNGYIPLSGNFHKTIEQTNDHLNNSWGQTAKYMGRIGYTPKGEDAYFFTFINQKSSSGIPLDAGNHPLYGYGCDGSFGGTTNTLSNCWYSFRSWPKWDKINYDFHSNTGIGNKSSLKLRLFYDQYPNLMDFFKTPNPVSSNMSSWVLNPSSTTLYDDHSDGLSAEYNTKLIRRNSVSASIYFKDDTHKEVPETTPSNTGYTTYGFKTMTDRQQIATIGLQDIVTVRPNLIVTFGSGFDHLGGLRATDSSTYLAYYTTAGATNAPACALANTNPLNFRACTLHQWAYSPLASVDYTFKDSSKLFLGFAQKNRFPGMKEMYSAKMGTSLANPSLATEHSENWQIAYSRVFKGNTVARMEYFRSDLQDALESISIADPGLTNADGTTITGGTAQCPNSKTPGTCGITMNASHETHQGAEFTLHTAPVKNLTFDGNYTYINKQIDGFNVGTAPYYFKAPCGPYTYVVTGTGDTTANQTTTPSSYCTRPTDLPKHKALGAVNVNLPYHAELNSTLRYESGARTTDSYSVKTKISGVTYTNYYYEVFRASNFATWDVGGSVELAPNAKLQAGVKNLLDRNYYYSFGSPEEGRNWFINMRYSF